MLVCLTLPVYNEEKVLRANVEEILRALEEHTDVDWRVVIAVNGSTDATAVIAKDLITSLRAPTGGISVIERSESGRGGALKQAWQATLVDWYFYMDIDLAVDLKGLGELKQLMQSGRADIIIGSRYIPGAIVERSFARTVLSEVYNVLCRRLVDLNVTDAQCGWKAVNARVAREIVPLVKDNRWFFDTELLALAQQRGIKIVEMPVRWVETRNRARKSKVRIAATIVDYVRNLRRVKRALR